MSKTICSASLMGPPAADRRLLENEHRLGMCAAHRRVARREICPPQDDSWRHLLGKAAELKEYCQWLSLMND